MRKPSSKPDSCPMAEPDPSLIETMRWDGGVPLLALHCRRMRRSARALGYAFEADAFEAVVAGAASGASGPVVIRVVLTPEGRLRASVRPFVPWPEPVRLALFRLPLPRADALRFHKTDRRSLFDHALALAREAGCDEAVFVNEGGALTEGCRTNLYRLRGGRLVTPPKEEGLLCGVYRSHLLASGRARTSRLTPDDLAGDSLRVSNAVQGMRRAVFNGVIVG